VLVPSAPATDEPVTSPIPIVEPVTSPIPVIDDRSGNGQLPDAQHARQAAVLSGLVSLVLLAGLLLSLGVI
jgi:hypothetical protein